MHNASKVALGTSQSSFRLVDNKPGAIAAGTIVRQKSDGTISIAKADGEALGISFGQNLGSHPSTHICRAGLKVPVLLTAGFTPTIGAQVAIDDVTGIAKAAGAGVTGVNAVYASSTLTGIKEDGTEANVALIDFQGGL